MEVTKRDTHLVLKRSDIDKYLSDDENKAFAILTKKLAEMKLKDKGKINQYYICNIDEPYADKVLNTILEGEEEKSLRDIA